MLQFFYVIFFFILVLIFEINSFVENGDEVTKVIVVYPKWIEKKFRGKRNADDEEAILQLPIGGGTEGFYLSLRRNDNLMTNLGVIQWHFPNGTVQTLPLKNVLENEDASKNLESSETEDTDTGCLFIGNVVGRPSSLAAVEICDGYHGYIQIGTDGYIIRPLMEAIYSSEDSNYWKLYNNKMTDKLKKTDAPHVLEGLGDSINNLNVRDDFQDIKDFKKMKFDYENYDDFWSNQIDENPVPSNEAKNYEKIDGVDESSHEFDEKLFDNDIRVTISSKYNLVSEEERDFSSNNHRLKRSEDNYPSIDEILASRDTNLGRSPWDGYYLGDIWSSGLGHSKSKYAKRRNRPTENTGQIICNGPFCDYYQVKKDDPKWLKLAVAVDSDVIAFHGSHTVKRYVLTLLNIMSAIYGDPTLGANLKFVILRIIFYEGDPENFGEGKQFDPIEDGNSKQSLENVNQWNDALWKSLPSGDRHDAAIWLTRRNIGGPSGYAPVAGICDPARSCSLNRDEGLSSAFIIAHELGHILGMSHDGDLGAGNDCKDEASQGSVMAPMVGATFSYFHWSSCSASEYHFKSSSWTCMLNYPHTPKNATFIGDTIQYTYSLDDQCRMEFGKGFKFCRSFQLNDPCTHLWCSHQQSPDVCKTKKGPPMDGTECGKGLWCVSGFCESMEKRRTNKDGLRHNPRSGGWSPWGTWGDCSRSCGTGVQFRSRQCDNPRPAYGGSSCEGDGEEFRLCNIESCPAQVDFRALQCKHLFEVVSMDILARDLELGGLVDGARLGDPHQTWYPYEHDEPSYKCKLTCYSRDTGEYYQTGENVIDGTPCSYDDPNNICVQGKCIQLGCDKIIDSPVKEDDCGICGGDGSKCRQKNRIFSKSISKTGSSKLMMIPAGARNIRISFKSSENVSISLKERDTNLVLVHGSELLRRNRTSFVSEGAKFNYTKTKINLGHEEETISARGPILGPIVVFAMSEVLNSSFDAAINFTISKMNEPLSTVQQYEWVMKGWSKCSKECGGGKQHIIMGCMDKFTGRHIRKKLCGKRPASVGKSSRKCNTFGCDFSWLADRWEECSATCGLHGIRIRQTYCVPNSVIIRGNRSASGDEQETFWTDSERPWVHMVNPRKCRGNRPPRVQECNRTPCPAMWTPVGWSSCSVSCGEGVERRLYDCLPPGGGEIFFDCGIEPISERKCQQSPCLHECQADESPICKEEVMKRYCVIPSYRKRCCVSCLDSSVTDSINRIS